MEGRADAARAELEELVLAGPAAEDLGEVGRDPHPERRRGQIPPLQHAYPVSALGECECCCEPADACAEKR